MAHKLNFRSNGVASFASKKEPAWHGLGTVVDAMTSKEAIELGGLNFTVEKRPIFVESAQSIPFEEAGKFPTIIRSIEHQNFYEGEHGEIKKTKKVAIYRPSLVVPDKYATVRTDNNLPLGIVGSKYTVIQNIEAFEFIDSIIGKGIADYETVGALGNGETVFITCKLRQELIINKDLIDQYLLITMSHDGSSSITVMFTPTRVVCNNTLSVALRGNRNKVTIRHTQNAKSKLEEAKKVLGIVDQQTLAYKEAFGVIYNKSVSDEKAKEIIAFSLGIKPDEKGEISTRAFNTLEMANNYYHSGIGQEGIVGNGWGVFNGITGYLQNSKEYSNAELKFKNTFLGGSVDIRDKALQSLLTL
jgi:phage/plasmid-like protein (TIGR03299 family)